VSVVFHTLAGAAVAHVATVKVHRRADGQLERPGWLLVIAATGLAVLSHGILDGLKHGYPVPARVDVCVSALVATTWCFAVRPPLAILFAFAMAGSFSSDVIDHAPRLLFPKNSQLAGILPRENLFPWHWRDGSGSLWSGEVRAAHNLDSGRNRQVSFSNEAIVTLCCLGCITATPWALRFVRMGPAPQGRPTSTLGDRPPA
jgi:hypothetical protein